MIFSTTLDVPLIIKKKFLKMLINGLFKQYKNQKPKEKNIKKIIDFFSLHFNLYKIKKFN